MSDLQIEYGKVYIDGVELRWPILSVNSNDTGPFFEGRKKPYPYRGFVVGCENGWLVGVSLNMSNDTAEEGTTFQPQVTVCPSGSWTDMVNDLVIRDWMKANGGWEKYIIVPKPYILTEKLADFINEVGTWPSPPLGLISMCTSLKTHPLYGKGMGRYPTNFIG